MCRCVSDDVDSLPSGIVEEDADKMEKSSLAERPRPLGEDVSLTISMSAETDTVKPISSIVNRVFKVAFLGLFIKIFFNCFIFHTDHILSSSTCACLSLFSCSLHDCFYPTHTHFPISGDSGVGKSSLILRLCEGRFNATCVSTLGLDFSTKILTVAEERVMFQLWDTAGQER